MYLDCKCCSIESVFYLGRDLRRDLLISNHTIDAKTGSIRGSERDRYEDLPACPTIICPARPQQTSHHVNPPEYVQPGTRALRVAESHRTTQQSTLSDVVVSERENRWRTARHWRRSRWQHNVFGVGRDITATSLPRILSRRLIFYLDMPVSGK